jgi:hypothetical protein
MAKHTGTRRRTGGFKRSLRRLFSFRTGGTSGPVASAAEPPHVKSGPSGRHGTSARK